MRVLLNVRRWKLIELNVTMNVAMFSYDYFNQLSFKIICSILNCTILVLSAAGDRPARGAASVAPAPPEQSRRFDSTTPDHKKIHQCPTPPQFEPIRDHFSRLCYLNFRRGRRRRRRHRPRGRRTNKIKTRNSQIRFSARPGGRLRPRAPLPYSLLLFQSIFSATLCIGLNESIKYERLIIILSFCNVRHNTHSEEEKNETFTLTQQNPHKKCIANYMNMKTQSAMWKHAPLNPHSFWAECEFRYPFPLTQSGDWRRDMIFLPTGQETKRSRCCLRPFELYFCPRWEGSPRCSNGTDRVVATRDPKAGVNARAPTCWS